jgi:hypothetical protein
MSAPLEGSGVLKPLDVLLKATAEIGARYRFSTG